MTSDPTSFRPDVDHQSTEDLTEGSLPHSAPLLVSQQPAPEDYYQNTFTEIVSFVATHYGRVVPGAVLQTLQRFLQADDQSKRLLARLLTRKGPVFFENNLSYREVGETKPVLLALEANGLIQRGARVPADVLLTGLTKSTLLTLFANTLAGFPKAKNQRKETLIHHLLGHRDDASIRATLWSQDPWCTIAQIDHWQLAQMLYFGRSGQDWSTHVRRDLGQIRYELVPLSEPRFASAGNLETYLHERRLSQLVYRLDEFPQLLPALLRDLVQPMPDPMSNRLRKRSLLRVGKWCERREQWPAALEAYRSAGIPPSRERRVRILYKLGREAESEMLRKQMAASPQSATESVFAQRFNRRGQGFNPETAVWDLEQPQASVERYVLETLVAQGGWGVHSENSLVKTLTGLIYWEAIFSPQPGAFTNPFQIAPHDLHEPDFFSLRAEQITDIESRICLDADLASHLKNINEAKQGIANPLVNWGLLERIDLDQWLQALPGDWIRVLSHFLVRNLKDYRKGFPDLFVSHPDGVSEFIEVKGPGDQLQPQQRAWFETFERFNIRARVINLRL